MTEIDLSKYVGKEVICTLEGGEIHSGLVRELDPAYKFPYGIGRCDFDISGKGYSKSQIESIQLKNPMTEIDLSKYVGKEVILTLNNNQTLSDELKFLKKHHSPYCYVVDGYQFTQTGEGLSKPQIESIQLKTPMTGIAQQHPNINLEDFEGQRCYVKWTQGREEIGLVKSDGPMWQVATSLSVCRLGTFTPGRSFIREIYGEGAYEITTKDTFDAPSTDAVEKATEALKDLTEEQIAKVLHALKGKY
jgi:hypothetical protein